jgi:hypothetical protein
MSALGHCRSSHSAPARTFVRCWSNSNSHETVGLFAKCQKQTRDDGPDAGLLSAIVQKQAICRRSPRCLTTLLVERVKGGGNLFAFLRVRTYLIKHIHQFGVVGSQHIQ